MQITTPIIIGTENLSWTTGRGGTENPAFHLFLNGLELASLERGGLFWGGRGAAKKGVKTKNARKSFQFYILYIYTFFLHRHSRKLSLCLYVNVCACLPAEAMMIFFIVRGVWYFFSILFSLDWAEKSGLVFLEGTRASCTFNFLVAQLQLFFCFFVVLFFCFLNLKRGSSNNNPKKCWIIIALVLDFFFSIDACYDRNRGSIFRLKCVCVFFFWMTGLLNK